MDALPNQSTCNTACDAVQSVSVPGAAGVNGSAGVNGTNGVSAFTLTTATLTMPAELANVTVAVGNSAWATVGEIVFVQGAGFFQVAVVPNNSSLTLKNLKDTANSAYLSNVAPATVVSANAMVTPAGLQGPSGALTGAAGGDLEGTYPNPTSKVTTTKGDLIVNNNAAVAPRNTRLAVGTNGKTLHANSGTGTGLEWRTFDMAGVNTLISGALPLTNGGTGQVTAAAAMDALSPVTTRGDIIVRSATTNARLAVGAASRVLTSDGTDPSWGQVTAAMIAASAKFLGRYGLLGSLVGVSVNALGDTLIAMASSRYRVDKIVLENASINLNTATAGVFSAAGGVGTIAADQVLSACSAANKYLALTLSGLQTTDIFTGANLYFRVGTIQGSAATVNVWVFGQDFS